MGVPQLPGHTGTIPGCPHLPPTNHVSEYLVYHSYMDTPGLSRDVHTCPPQTMCLSIPSTTVTRNILGCPHLPPTNHVSEYPMYHSNLDTLGLSRDVHMSEYPVYHSYLDTLWTIPGCPTRPLPLPPHTNHVSEYPM